MTDTHAPATAAGPTDVALLDDTIGDNLRRTIAAHGANEALVARHQGLRWTYDELGARVERLSAGLMGLGLEAGDRVGLWSPNYAEWTLIHVGCAVGLAGPGAAGSVSRPSSDTPAAGRNPALTNTAHNCTGRCWTPAGRRSVPHASPA